MVGNSYMYDPLYAEGQVTHTETLQDKRPSIVQNCTGRGGIVMCMKLSAFI
jgi:hypothetical protein